MGGDFADVAFIWLSLDIGLFQSIQSSTKKAQKSFMIFLEAMLKGTFVHRNIDEPLFTFTRKELFHPNVWKKVVEQNGQSEQGHRVVESFLW